MRLFKVTLTTYLLATDDDAALDLESGYCDALCGEAHNIQCGEMYGVEINEVRNREHVLPSYRGCYPWATENALSSSLDDLTIDDLYTQELLRSE